MVHSETFSSTNLRFHLEGYQAQVHYVLTTFPTAQPPRLMADAHSIPKSSTNRIVQVSNAKVTEAKFTRRSMSCAYKTNMFISSAATSEQADLVDQGESIASGHKRRVKVQSPPASCEQVFLRVISRYPLDPTLQGRGD